MSRPLAERETVRDVLIWMKENWPDGEARPYATFSKDMRRWCLDNLHPRNPVARRLHIVAAWAEVMHSLKEPKPGSIIPQIRKLLRNRETAAFIRRVLKEEGLPLSADEMSRETLRGVAVLLCHTGWVGIRTATAEIMTQVVDSARLMGRLNELVEKAVAARQAEDDLDFAALTKLFSTYARVLRNHQDLVLPLTLLLNPHSARQLTMAPRFQEGVLSSRKTIRDLEKELDATPKPARKPRGRGRGPRQSTRSSDRPASPGSENSGPENPPTP